MQFHMGKQRRRTKFGEMDRLPRKSCIRGQFATCSTGGKGGTSCSEVFQASLAAAS